MIGVVPGQVLYSILLTMLTSLAAQSGMEWDYDDDSVPVSLTDAQ